MKKNRKAIKKMKLIVGCLIKSIELPNLVSLTKKIRREKSQIIKIRNEREDITTNLTEIERIIKEYYEQL